MDYAVKVRNITKQFKETIALKNVTVSFEKGNIYGIIGRNGSGKTVLFKCICGLLPVTEGEITVLNQKIGDGLRVPKGVGAVIETPGFSPMYPLTGTCIILLHCPGSRTGKGSRM